MSVYENAFNAIKFVYMNRLRYDIIDILDDFSDLNLLKTKLVCEIAFRKRAIIMNDFPFSVRKKIIYMKISNIQDFLKIIKDNDIERLEIFECKTVCSRKICNNWHPTIKLYNSCKCLEPKKKCISTVVA